MRFRVDDVAHYKKVITAICSIPSVRKQLNGVEQCIELQTNGDEGVIEISTVDLSSHTVTLKVAAEVVEEGRQLVLSTKLKAMTSKLTPKNGLEVSNENNLLNYTAKPYGSIVDNQYFSQDSYVSKELLDETDWKDVSPELGFFLGLISVACANTYQDREIYMTSAFGAINMYVQFSETSYIRYKTQTETNATIQDFRAAIRPALFKMVQLLGEDVDLQYCPKKGLVKFSSIEGTVVINCDMSPNKIALKIDSIVDGESDAEVQITHEDIIESLKFQSYGTTETDVVSLDFDQSDETFLISTSELSEAAKLKVSYSGLFDKTSLSVGHLTKALKAMGSPRSKILPVEVVKVQIKTQPVKNAKPIKIIHLSPEIEMDVTSDVVMYEVTC